MGRKVWVPVVSGPLAPYAAGFESWLASRAYSPSAAADRLYQFDQLSRWLEREGLGVGELTGEQAERFAAARRAAGRGDVGRAAERDAAAWVLARAGGRADAGAGCSRRARWRSCSLTTAAICWSSAGCQSTRCSMRMGRPRGCSWPGGTARTGWAWSGCRAADVSLFLARECPKRSVSGARDLVCALRSLLRYLHLAGLIDGAAGVGGPVGRRSAGSHAAARAGAGGGQAGCWPAAIGARWSAGVTSRSCCCCRGWGCAPARSPRSRLDDVDWRAGLLLVRGKGSRHDALPLPVDVGEALVAYLRRRPRCESPGAVLAGDRAARRS